MTLIAKRTKGRLGGNVLDGYPIKIVTGGRRSALSSNRAENSIIQNILTTKTQKRDHGGHILILTHFTPKLFWVKTCSFQL